MKKNIIVATFILLFLFSSELSYSQGITNQHKQLIENKFIQKQQIEIEPVISNCQKVAKITGWDLEISKYFVNEAENRGVLIFDEAIPIISKETGGTYDFNLIHYNTNGTKDVGIFQINDITKQDIVRLLEVEGREFDSWSRMNREFNISGGLCWLNYLKGKGLEGHGLFTSYNRGIAGAKNYASRNGTYVSRYSRDVVKARNEINKIVNK